MRKIVDASQNVTWSKLLTFNIRAFIFHICNLFVSTNIFYLLTFTGIFDLHVNNFNIDHKFWTVAGRAFIFDNFYIPSDKTFLSVPFFFYLDRDIWLTCLHVYSLWQYLSVSSKTFYHAKLRPWPWPLTYMLRTNTTLKAGDHISLNLFVIIY